MCVGYRRQRIPQCLNFTGRSVSVHEGMRHYTKCLYNKPCSVTGKQHFFLYKVLYLYNSLYILTQKGNARYSVVYSL